MLGQGWILTLVSVGITALAPAPYERNEESLRSALDAVTRKRISLEPASQEYYNDFPSLKYHAGDVERMFERERQADRILPKGEEELEFLPNGENEHTINQRFSKFFSNGTSHKSCNFNETP